MKKLLLIFFLGLSLTLLGQPMPISDELEFTEKTFFSDTASLLYLSGNGAGVVSIDDDGVLGFGEIGSRILFSNTATVGTGANTDATILYTDTLPANTLVNNGDFIDIEFALSGNATNSAAVQVYFGGTALVDIAYLSYSDDVFKSRVTRVNGTNQKFKTMGTTSVSLETYSLVGTAAETLSGEIIIAIVATNVASVANTVVFEGWEITKN